MREAHGHRSLADAGSGWTWRHVLTVLLLAVTMPVFLIAAAAAALVAAPLLVGYGLVQAVRSFQSLSPSPRRLVVR